MIDLSKKRHRLRIIDPAYPAFNVYSFSARRTTPLGPVCVATAANEMEGWDVEVIDEAGNPQAQSALLTEINIAP